MQSLTINLWIPYTHNIFNRCIRIIEKNIRNAENISTECKIDTAKVDRKCIYNLQFAVDYLKLHLHVLRFSESFLFCTNNQKLSVLVKILKQ